MNAKVKMNPTSVIKARLGIQKGGPAHAFFTNTCYRYMGQFVPGGIKGLLNQNVDIDTDKITYKSPYARYQYHGELYVDPFLKIGGFPIRGGKISFNPSDGIVEGFVSRKGVSKIASGKPLNYHTPGTGSFWDKKMWTSRGKEVVKEVQDFVDRGCK